MRLQDIKLHHTRPGRQDKDKHSPSRLINHEGIFRFYICLWDVEAEMLVLVAIHQNFQKQYSSVWAISQRAGFQFTWFNNGG